MRARVLAYVLAVLPLLGCADGTTAVPPAMAEESEEGAAGVVRAGQLTGPVTGSIVRYNIYLPPGYDEGNARYPVSYFLHGVNGNETSHNEIVVEGLEQAVNAGIIAPMLVVFPNGWGDVYWGDSKDGSKPAETNVIRELVPHIDATYRTIADRDHRFMQGHSMGGYGALLYAMKYPDLFSKCVSWDGAIHIWETLAERRPSVTRDDYGNDEEYFAEYSPWTQATRHADDVRGRVDIRLVVGGLLEFNRRYRDYLNTLEIEVDYVETGCPHDLDCLMQRDGRGSFGFLAVE